MPNSLAHNMCIIGSRGMAANVMNRNEGFGGRKGKAASGPRNSNCLVDSVWEMS